MAFTPLVMGLSGPLPGSGTLVSLQDEGVIYFSIDLEGNAAFHEIEADVLKKAAAAPLGAILTALCNEVARLRRELESVRSRVE